MNLTFYKLLNGYQDNNIRYLGRKIIIPRIQRDYAQGRVSYLKKGEEDTSAKPYQIRKDLIEKLSSCLNVPVDLNFVYGKNNEVNTENGGREVQFIPIDGQQRLTTLYLLHWYIFWRCRDEDGISILAKGFSYESRDTTKLFCNYLCGINTDDCSNDNRITILKELYVNTENKKSKALRDNLLSTYIKNKVWFVNSLYEDPSVRSMLVMLDTIEKQFISFSTEDFELYSQNLKSDYCRITFSYLGVDDFDEKDMYIKMNARGKELTNFEIFKAKLEEKQEILKDVCYYDENPIEDIQKKISGFIGKYNNEYTNLFYSKIGRESFDKAMFNYLRCLIKLDHFAYVSSSTEINEKDYRDTISNYEYSGSMLFNDYFLIPTLHGYENENSDMYRDELRKISKLSLRKATGILDYFIKNGFEKFDKFKELEKDQFYTCTSITVDETFTIENKLFLLHGDEKHSNIVSVIQHALYSFLFDFCLKNSDNERKAYLQWKRFILNTMAIYNSKETANIAKMSGIYIELLKKIKECSKNGIEEDTVTKVIADFDSYKLKDSMSITSILFIFERESRKSRLMLENEEWKNIIYEAENYYVDGDIDFLFEAAGDVDSLSFKRMFEHSKKWLNEYKTPKNAVLFNEALLCMDYPKENKTAHLITDGWRFNFYYRNNESKLREMINWPNEKYQRQGLINLLQKNDIPANQLYDNNITVENYVEQLISNYIDIEDCELRNILVKRRILSNIEKNSVPDKPSGSIGLWNGTLTSGLQEYVLFKETAYNSKNVELKTYALYCLLLSQTDNVELVWCKGSTRDPSLRYVSCNDKRIGYDIDNHMYIDIDSKNTYQDIEEAKEYLLN